MVAWLDGEGVSVKANSCKAKSIGFGDLVTSTTKSSGLINKSNFDIDNELDGV